MVRGDTSNPINSSWKLATAATWLVVLLAMTTAISLATTEAKESGGNDATSSQTGENDASSTDSNNICTADAATSAAKAQSNRHPFNRGLLLYSFDSITSTQDAAKQIAEINMERIPEAESFCVTTREQTKGRGTNGRVWMGQRGNTFVTIAFRQQDWMKLPSRLPLTLLPLKIGSLVAARVQALLEDCRAAKPSSSKPKVSVKWPNDVLVDSKKIAGVLIESSSNGWFLIGIGINLAYAPPVPSSGENQGRPSTSIQDYCIDNNNTIDWENGDAATQLGIDLAYDLSYFVKQEQALEIERETYTSGTRASRVLEEWKAWVDWDMDLVLRDSPNQEKVKLLDVLADGRVKVGNQKTGKSRILVSDYFL